MAEPSLQLDWRSLCNRKAGGLLLPWTDCKGQCQQYQCQSSGGCYGGSIANSTINNGSSAIMGSSANTSYNGSGSTYVAGAVQGGNFNQKRIGDLSQNAQLQQAVTQSQTLTGATMKSSLGALSKQLSELTATG